MSQLTNENIAQWFFRYTEGTLSTQEKDQFMSYLLEHPEYNDEFVLWANTKISVDEDLVDLDLEKGLLRPQAVPHKHKFNKWFWGTATTVLLTGALYYLLLQRQEEAPGHHTHTPVQQPTKTWGTRVHGTPQKAVLKPAAQKSDVQELSTSPEHKPSVLPQAAQSPQSDILTPAPQAEHTNPISHRDSVSLHPIPKYEADVKHMPDSISQPKQPHVQAPSSEPVRIERGRKAEKKEKASFKRSAKFQKDNTDF